MNKLWKVSAVYALISAVAMGVVWIILLSSGRFSEEMSRHPAQYSFLAVAEILTAGLLLAGGIGLMRKSPKALKIFYIGMGMMFYAVIFAAGKFLNLGFPYFSVLFIGVAVATAVILSLHLFATEEP